MSLNGKGTLLLVNCHDRVIRLFELQPRSTLSEGAEEGYDEEQVAAALNKAKVGREMDRQSLSNGFPPEGPCPHLLSLSCRDLTREEHFT
jgi:hypothetical protein